MIYMVWPKAYIYGQRWRKTSSIVKEDYDPRTLKSQSLNYTRKETQFFFFLIKIFSYIFS